jgi:hypothetical protein
MNTEGSLPCSQNLPSPRPCVSFLKKETFLLTNVERMIKCCDHETEQVVLEIMPRSFFRKVLDPNPGQDVSNLHRGFSWFSSVPTGKSRPRQLPTKSLTVHQSSYHPKLAGPVKGEGKFLHCTILHTIRDTSVSKHNVKKYTCPYA